MMTCSVSCVSREPSSGRPVLCIIIDSALTLICSAGSLWALLAHSSSYSVQLLLYGEERMQADNFIADGTLPSAVYGAEHLLRLFVKLPEYLPIAGSTEDQYRLLQDKLHEVLDFMNDKSAEFFLPTDEYIVPMQT